MSFTIDPVVSLSTIAALCAFLFSIISFLVSQSKNRQLQRRKYADKIRRAAAKPTIALNRRREVTLGVINELQPIFVDADIQLVRENDILAVRDYVWRGISVCLAESARKISDENLEGAYGELYGYDTRIQALYQGALDRLNQIDLIFQEELLYRTQINVLEFSEDTMVANQIQSAALGNKLRTTSNVLLSSWRSWILQVVDPVHDDLLRLIHESDDAIVNHQIEFRTTEEFVELNPRIVDLKDEFANMHNNQKYVAYHACFCDSSQQMRIELPRLQIDDMKIDRGMMPHLGEISNSKQKLLSHFDESLQKSLRSNCLTKQSPVTSNKIKQPRQGRGHRQAK